MTTNKTVNVFDYKTEEVKDEYTQIQQTIDKECKHLAEIALYSDTPLNLPAQFDNKKAMYTFIIVSINSIK